MSDTPFEKNFNTKCGDSKYLSLNNIYFWVGIVIMLVGGGLAIAMIFIDNANYLTNWTTWVYLAMVFVGLVLTLFSNSILNKCEKQNNPQTQM